MVLAESKANGVIHYILIKFLVQIITAHMRDTYSKKRTPKNDYLFLSSSLNRVEVGNSYHSTNNHNEHDATGSDAEQEVLEGR